MAVYYREMQTYVAKKWDILWSPLPQESIRDNTRMCMNARLPVMQFTSHNCHNQLGRGCRSPNSHHTATTTTKDQRKYTMRHQLR